MTQKGENAKLVREQYEKEREEYRLATANKRKKDYHLSFHWLLSITEGTNENTINQGFDFRIDLGNEYILYSKVDNLIYILLVGQVKYKPIPPKYRGRFIIFDLFNYKVIKQKIYRKDKYKYITLKEILKTI